MAEGFLLDGQNDFLGGQDASKVSSKVPQDSVASAVNATFSKGVPGPRWGQKKRKLTFPEGGVAASSGIIIPYEEIFHTGRFHSAFNYQIGSENFAVVVISGITFLVSIELFTVQVLSVAGGELNENVPRHNWSEAGDFNVIYDFPNFPVILEGNTIRRADPAKFEVPISVLGAYNQNRLAIANAGNDFTLGDPTGSLATPDAPITFTEVELIASPYFGQIFELPTGVADGAITAIGFIQAVDTSTGIGPMFVATANQVFTYQTQLPRNLWENGQFGSLFIATSGIPGPRAFVNVNSDLFFLSSDYQVRSASMSRDEQKRWSKVPVSREVENWLYTRDKSLAPYNVMGYFFNKIFVATNPYRVEAKNLERQPVLDIAHAGFVVMELDNQATLGKESLPVWAGLWTGLRPMEIFTTNLGQRCFVMSKDDGGRNELWEILPDKTYDEDIDGTVRQVTTILDTRQFSFESSFDNKALHSIDLSFEVLKGDFKASVFFKPAQGTEFAKWGELSNIAPWRTCNVPDGCFANGFASHEIRDQTFGYPVQNTICDPVGKTTYNICKKVQLRFVIEAIYWQLEEYRLKAMSIPTSQQISTCSKASDEPVCQPCDVNPWLIKPFKFCPPVAPADPCAIIDMGVRFCGECEPI